MNKLGNTRFQSERQNGTQREIERERERERERSREGQRATDKERDTESEPLGARGSPANLRPLNGADAVDTASLASLIFIGLRG